MLRQKIGHTGEGGGEGSACVWVGGVCVCGGECVCVGGVCVCGGSVCVGGVGGGREGGWGVGGRGVLVGEFPSL